MGDVRRHGRHSGVTMGRRENGLVTLTPVTSQWGSSTTDMWGRKQLGDSQDLGKGPSHLQGADTSLSRLSAGACGGCAPRANLAVTAARGRAEVLYRRHQEKHDGGRRTQKRGSPDIKFLLGPLPRVEGLVGYLGIAPSGIHPVEAYRGWRSGMAGASARHFRDGMPRRPESVNARQRVGVAGG